MLLAFYAQLPTVAPTRSKQVHAKQRKAIHPVPVSKPSQNLSSAGAPPQTSGRSVAKQSCGPGPGGGGRRPVRSSVCTTHPRQLQPPPSSLATAACSPAADA